MLNHFVDERVLPNELVFYYNNKKEITSPSLSARFPSEQRFSSNTSTDSTRYATSNRSISVESRPAALYGPPQPSGPTSASGGPSSAMGAAVGVASNRNSMKDTNSNRSSMDVSTCSYNTLIIHPDDQQYASSMNGSRDYSSPSELVMNTSTTSSSVGKKDRPRSYGEQVSCWVFTSYSISKLLSLFKLNK